METALTNEQAPTKYGPGGNKGRWLPGTSGNPAGRPISSRQKLGEAFLKDLLADWKQNGKDAIVKMRKKDAVAYCRVIASVLPRELVFTETSEIDAMTPEEMSGLLQIIRQMKARTIDAEATTVAEAEVIEAMAAAEDEAEAAAEWPSADGH